MPKDQTSPQDRQQVATLLGLPEEHVPDLRLKWCRLRQNPQGELWACCPKVPSDLEAKVGYHIDTKDPAKKERVFGYLHQKTTAINRKLAKWEFLCEQARYVRVCIPRRAMHASCDSPWHV